MHNIEIRTKLKENRIYGYEIAAQMGIAETSFSRKMARREMTANEKEKIYQIIDEIKEKK